MTPQYILRKSLCREPHCATEAHWQSSAICQIDNLGYAADYAEPGYDSPRRGVLFANWNYFPTAVTDILERYGFAVEWSDEWALCEDCYQAVRTSPDCWFWQPNYKVIGDCTLLCKKCAKEAK